MSKTEETQVLVLGEQSGSSHQVSGPTVQLLGIEGEFHLIKVQYIFTDLEGKNSYRRAVILKIRPEDLPVHGFHDAVIKKKVSILTDWFS